MSILNIHNLYSLNVTTINRLCCLVACSACFMPATLTAQPMVVMGGGQKAQECFMNAEIAAQNLPGTGRGLLQACDYTLKFAKLTMQDRAATLANRGIVYAALKNYDAAMADYDTAITIKPSAPEFYINRGNSFFMIREYANALNDYDQSLALGLEQVHFAHYNKGMVYERLGNDAIAEREYREALRLAPQWNLPADRLEIIRIRMVENAVLEEQQ